MSFSRTHACAVLILACSGCTGKRPVFGQFEDTADVDAGQMDTTRSELTSTDVSSNPDASTTEDRPSEDETPSNSDASDDSHTSDDSGGEKPCSDAVDACPEALPVCLNGVCVECDPGIGEQTGQRACAGDTPQWCNADGSWAAQEPCAEDEPICLVETGTCGCAEGTFACSNATLRSCDSDSQWVVAETCSGDTSLCNAVTGACECAEGTAECTADSGSARTCVDGQWELSSCGAEQVCWNGSCGECDPDNFTRREGDTACGTNGVLAQDCVAGTWRDTSECVPCRRGITFPDETVDWWIRRAITDAVDGEPIPFDGEILAITELLVWGSPKPEDLAGMECVANLEILSVLTGSGANLRNVGALAGLNKLAYLDIEGYNVDLQPLTNGLPALQNLRLDNCGLGPSALSSIQTLGGGNLLGVVVSNNPIGDLSQLGSLPLLTVFRCRNCGLATLEPIFGFDTLLELNVEGNEHLDCQELDNFADVTVVSDCE